MGVNGKQKGNNFERKIANMLSARFEPVTGIKQAFSRNPDSGSFWGATNQKRIETHNLEFANFGDLLCPKNFLYSIECKHYKTAPSLQAIMLQKVAQWDEWIKQCTQDAKNASKKPALIVKYNNVNEIVFLQDLYVGMSPIINYQGFYVHLLETFLEQDNSIFFESH